MRKLKQSLFFVFIGITTFSTAQIRTTAPKVKQTDLIEVLVNAFNIKVKEKPPGKKQVSFSIVPVSTTSSGGNKIFVSSINAGFRSQSLPLPHSISAKCGGRRHEKRFKISGLREPH